MDPSKSPQIHRALPRKQLKVDVNVRRIDVLNGLKTRVYFHVVNRDVRFGETVRVVGSHPSLGNWDHSRGMVLHTNEDIFPVWISGDPAFVELHSEVSYKYVVCNSDGSIKAWEAEANRSFVANGEDMTIEDDEGLYRQLVSQKDDEGDETDEQVDLRGISPTMTKHGADQKLAFVRELEGDVAITTTDTIFMLGFQLPINLRKGDDGNWVVDKQAPNDGRNFAFLPLLEELRKKTHVKVVNVGWPGVHVDNYRERGQIERLLAEYDCIPVFPPRKEFEHFVEFCTTFLWPVFHDDTAIFQTSNPRPYNERHWAAFQHVNNIYALAVVPHTHESDLIWVHDYHVLMTPTFISRKLHKANIGFYLHTPFPSSDSFRSLPMREELLSGMLCADQIGFQFFMYARNFLVSCKRIFGLDPVYRAGGFVGLDYNGRNIMLKVAHFVYPYKDTQAIVGNETVSKRAAQVQLLFKDKTIFCCMDRCDNLSGLIPKFRAFRWFLKKNPSYKGKVVLVQYCFGRMGGFEGEDACKLMKALQEEADAFLQCDDDKNLSIQTKNGSGVDDCDIFLRIGKIDREERLGLFKAADILLDTSVKNGLNLMPFEFITAHHEESARRCVSIVSEFSGCSRVLLGSLRVNPWNTLEVVSACERAMTMADDERKERAESNLLYVAENSPMSWFEDFLTDLRRARKKDSVRVDTIGFGAKLRQVCVGSDFQKLSVDAVIRAYKNSKNRVIFLDNEGTLAADKRHILREYSAPKGDVLDLKSHGSPPDEAVLDCLKMLCSDSRNTVVILSGRNRELLEEWFGSVPRIGMAAERGFYYKLPITTGDKWHCLVQHPDYTWKTFAFEIMRQFVKRTQGSFIENKGSALVWQYRDADQHFGSWQAKELSSHLKELLFGFDVEVMEGKGYVEVKLRGINKGVAVTKTLTKVSQAFGEVDFILCIGDDRSDEDMFEAVNQILEQCDEASTDVASQSSTMDGDAESDSHSDRGHVDRLPSKTDSALLMKSGSKIGIGSFRGHSFSGSLKSVSGNFFGDLRSLCKDGHSPTNASRRRQFFTCTVGRKPSAAKFYLDDTDEVSELLSSLKQLQTKRVKDPPNYNTWSGGDVSRGAIRHNSMPPLSSLSFDPS